MPNSPQHKFTPTPHKEDPAQTQELYKYVAIITYKAEDRSKEVIDLNSHNPHDALRQVLDMYSSHAEIQRIRLIRSSEASITEFA